MILMSPALFLRRPLESFRVSASKFELHYDASLYKVAVGVYVRSSSELRLLRFAAVFLPFKYSADSSKQNLREYLCVSVGVMLAASLGFWDGAYTLHGDNTSSLAWSAEDRVASDLARRANIGLVAISVLLNLHVLETVHVPGHLNVI